MGMTPEQWFAHVQAHTGPDGRLGLSGMTGWEAFPFEPDGLTVARLDPPVLPDPPRGGEGGRACWSCDRPPEAVWSDEHWRLAVETSGAPLLLMLTSRTHLDLRDLDDDRAGELGRILVHLVRAIEDLPHIARAHVSRWGDGGAHLHVFLYARPAGFGQLRGTCFAVWDDLLPPVPEAVRDADATAVARALAASYGGEVGPDRALS